MCVTDIKDQHILKTYLMCGVTAVDALFGLVEPLRHVPREHAKVSALADLPVRIGHHRGGQHHLSSGWGKLPGTIHL